ncbi:TIGR04222 domain-containing membrane protein [Nocardiopsis sediminis]|uniref:TIGR04222 domain-containing membrane protein n=1 Tax=Nocardiopsis sediminis TaxID=1778267 RepID=A0ABV8FR56_9ACTN
MVGAVVLGLTLCYAAIACCYALTRHRYARIRAGGPLRPPVGPLELSPFELGMLAGGAQRLGEVALAELYLTGRAVAHGHGAVARPRHTEGGPAPRPLSPAPFTRLLDARLPDDRTVPADQLVSAAGKGDPTVALLWRLRRLGLLFPPERMRWMRVVRRAAWILQALIGAAGVVAGGCALVSAILPSGGWSGARTVVFGLLLLAYPFLLHLTDRCIGGMPGAVTAAVAATAAAAPASAARAELLCALGLFGGWFALFGVYRLTGGGLGPRTLAGDALLAEARTGSPGANPVDAALRATALIGFRALRGRPGGLCPFPEGGLREFGLVRSFAAACGRAVGGPGSGLGGDFTVDGRNGGWGGAASTPGSRRPGHE